jgi:hypothetical protein
MLNNSYKISKLTWLLPEGNASRGTVVLVHGLGEHIGRYGHVAKFLNDLHFNVVGYICMGMANQKVFRAAFGAALNSLTI